MRRLYRWFVRLLARRDLADVEREVEEEFRFHLDMKTSALMAGGMSAEEARAKALQSFGDSEALRRAATRNLADARARERGASRMAWLNQDLRAGVRQLTRRPGFTLLAVVTLSLGLSTGTAVFTYVNAYTQPFPGADAKGLKQLFRSTEQGPWGTLSYPDFKDLMATAGTAYDVAGVSRSQFGATARTRDLTGVVFGRAVSGDFFSLLSVDMALGRGLGPSDNRPESDPVVVISYAYWVSRYGASQDALGQTLLLNNLPYTIVGVTGREFLGSSSGFRPEIWLPFEQFAKVYWARSDTRQNRNVGAVFPLLRVREGRTDAQVQQQLSALAANLDVEAPLSEGTRTFTLRPATWISPAARDAEASTAHIMVLAAACLLLLACANVANLVLSAGERRHREMALRTALGASRGRLIRQLLAENLLLSSLAGAVALIAAGPVGERLSSYFARPSVWGTNVPREIHVDARVMVFALIAAIATGALTGLLPALRIARRDPAATLRSGGTWSSAGRRGTRSRVPGTGDLLVTAQVAMSVVLLLVAGLVIRTLNAASRVDAGFDVEHTLASYVSTSSMGLPVAERHRFYGELIRRFEEMPWVEGATVAENAPLSGHPSQELRTDAGNRIETTVAKVWTNYFDVMGMRILSGRGLEPTDTVAATGVVVVNEPLAARMAPGGSAVGRNLWLPGENGEAERSFEVVGVVRAARQTTLLDDPEPVAYFSLPQHYSHPGNAFLVKVTGDPMAAVDKLARGLREVDAHIAIVNILPYAQVVRGFLYVQRMNAELFGVIAMLGVLLAAAGVFGVVALSVARRRREIGIRMAVGAGHPSVVSLVVGAVAGPVAAGIGLGGVGALLVMHLVKRILWGVAPSDPTALAVGSAVLLGALVLAVAVPVMRALSVDPVASLRAD